MDLKGIYYSLTGISLLPLSGFASTTTFQSDSGSWRSYQLPTGLTITGGECRFTTSSTTFSGVSFLTITTGKKVYFKYKLRCTWGFPIHSL